MMKPTTFPVSDLLHYAKGCAELVAYTSADELAEDIAFTYMEPSRIFRLWLRAVWFKIRCTFSR